MKLGKLARLCIHDAMRPHPLYEAGRFADWCPGGEFLTEDALETVWFCWLHKSAGIPGTYFCEMAGQASFIDSMLMEGLDPCDPEHHQMVEVLVVIPALDGEYTESVNNASTDRETP